jgi:RNA polymerase sigma-70 factor, ECF subfamily
VQPQNVTSLSLLERVRGRDAESWRRLVGLYRPLVEHWCRYGGVRDADVADVSQEVFLAVAGSLEEFRRQGAGGFRAWMRGITRYKVLDHHRRERARPAAAGGSAALRAVAELPDPQAGSQDESVEVGGLFRRALELVRGEFEERTWQAFWRTTVEGQATALVAAELGMTPVAVRVARSRVLARLREEAGELIE